jgi:cytochrome oxidase assembly protein ShyY1
MDHLTYIMAAYALAVLIGAGYAINAWSRMRRARLRLAAIDPREARVSVRGS